MKNKKKQDFEDDSRVIANMNVEGMRGYVPNKNYDKKNDYDLSKKEKKAVFKAIYKKLFVNFLIITVCFLIAILLIILWLK